VEYVYSEGISLPLRIPEWTQQVIQQGRLLGVVGSLLVLLFILLLLYSLLGQTRVLRWVEKQVRPLGEQIPPRYYPYFLSILKVGVSYNADPAEVEKILLDVAEKEPLVSDYQKPVLWYALSSLPTVP